PANRPLTRPSPFVSARLHPFRICEQRLKRIESAGERSFSGLGDPEGRPCCPLGGGGIGQEMLNRRRKRVRVRYDLGAPFGLQAPEDRLLTAEQRTGQDGAVELRGLQRIVAPDR